MVYRTTTLPPLFTLRREVDRLFEDAFGRAAAAPATWSPATDVREEADGYRFEIELPGIAPEQVEVTLEQGVLTVRGEKRATTATTTEAAAPKWHVAERVQGAFKRTFQLPQAVSEDRIAASFANGLLTVVVPKEAPRARKIDVTVA
ncbi:MAG: Hsp20/alpha crystallin family protein [Gemmatimonadetes bacterium]|nr:Hsp20/alpha crystallin family protein [Gemmatimonadota bacterium]MBP7550024.1 Hsp20/alpha crystallin family protein [Gemmatimonadaceae bacterium]